MPMTTLWRGWAAGLLAGVSCLAPLAWAGTPAEELAQGGAKLTESGGTVTQANVDATSFGAAEYELLSRLTGLKKLTINGKTLNDENLAKLASLTELEELSTNQTQLTDEGYKHFTAFKKLRSLALFHPSFGAKDFTGSGLKYLKELPALQRLTFAGATAGDTALEALGEVTQLKEFSTWHTAQTQAGNAHLLKLTHLTFLKMGQRLPKWGAAPAPSFDGSSLATFAKLASLERLELFEARLKAADFDALKALPKLKQLTLHTTDITPADVDALRAQFPAVKIDFKPLSDEDRAMLEKKLKL